MTLDDIKKLLHNKGESTTLELKKSTAQLKGAMESLCSFLNAQGGAVLIGINDQKKIVGQDVTDQTKREIANELKKIEPAANIDINYISNDQNNKTIIMLVAHPDHHVVPYTFDGRAYERKESSTHLMTQSAYQQLLLARNLKPISWESQIASSVSLDELDHTEILNMLKEGVLKNRIDPAVDTDDPIEVLKRFQLLEAEKPNNAAVVLFCKEIPGDFFQCVLRMARFHGTSKGALIDSKHIYGNIFQLLREAETFINRHTSVSSHIETGKLQREDLPEYPYKATREALVNAFCHRDYSAPSGSVALTIYDDRLEITNTGNLPSGITIDQLKRRHISVPRNNRILNVLYRRRYIEALGIGTEEIIAECRKAHVPEPEFSEDGATFTVILRSATYLYGAKFQLSPLQYNILAILENKGGAGSSLNEIRVELSTNIGLRGLRHELNKLKSQGAVATVGHGRGAKWKKIDKT